MTVAAERWALARALMSRRRLALLAQVAGLQSGVQALGLLAGLLLVRTLEPAQYALLTLALSATAVATVLGDLGLSSAVTALAGRDDLRAAGARRRWDALRVEASALQRRLFSVVVLVVAPACAWMLWQQQGSAVQVLGLSALALALALLQMRAALDAALARLAGHVAWQRLELQASAGRLLAVALACTWFVDATLALALALAAAAFTAQRLARWRRDWVAAEAPAAAGEATLPSPPSQKAALRRHLLLQGPNTLYYVLSSQFALWLVAALGESGAVADLGALGRLAAILALLSAVLAALAQPHFARQHRAAELGAALTLVHTGFAALTAALTALALAWPAALLSLLGPHYQGLQAPLPWLVVGSTLAAWSGALYSLGCARGWVLPPAWVVGGGLVSTALSVACFDVSSVAGALQMTTLVAATNLAMNHVFMRQRLRALAAA